MNNKTYNLVMAVLGSDLTQKTKDDVVRFFTLPRNTPVQSYIELVDDDTKENYGSIKRPDSVDLERKNNKLKQDEDEAMGQVFSKYADSTTKK